MRRVSMIALLFMIAFSAHAAGDVESVLKDVVAGTRPVADLTIIYSAGNPDFRGETTLTIEGDGKAEVVWKRGNDTKSYKKTIKPSGMQTLVKAMVDDRYWSAKPVSGPVVPDSAPITITLKTKQGDLDDKFSYLYNKAMDEKETQAVVRIFQSLIKTISKEKVKY